MRISDQQRRASYRERFSTLGEKTRLRSSLQHFCQRGWPSRDSPNVNLVFVHKIGNANPFFFGSSYIDDDDDDDDSSDSYPPPKEVWELQDVLCAKRRRCLDKRLERQQINVFKKGSTTGLTVGRLMKTISVWEADELYYLEEDLNGGWDGGNPNIDWVGMVAWLNRDEPFALDGDSGSFVYADEKDVRVPLGIHIGSVEEDAMSYFLSLEAFAERAQMEGIHLYFTT